MPSLLKSSDGVDIAFARYWKGVMMKMMMGTDVARSESGGAF